MKVLFHTEKVRGTSANFGDGKLYPVDAHFELQLHEGPPDPKTWEGGGQTVAYWREQFKGGRADPERHRRRARGRGADLADVDRVPSLTPAESQLDEPALEALLRDGGWTRDGESLTKSFRCKGWKGAIAFVDRIAVAADEVNHHPDVHIESYRIVRIVTTTHATGKLSDADVALARRIDELFVSP